MFFFFILSVVVLLGMVLRKGAVMRLSQSFVSLMNLLSVKDNFTFLLMVHICNPLLVYIMCIVDGKTGLAASGEVG